jgi:hypothetical protein
MQDQEKKSTVYRCSDNFWKRFELLMNKAMAKMPTVTHAHSNHRLKLKQANNTCTEDFLAETDSSSLQGGTP